MPVNINNLITDPLQLSTEAQFQLTLHQQTISKLPYDKLQEVASQLLISVAINKENVSRLMTQLIEETGI